MAAEAMNEAEIQKSYISNLRIRARPRVLYWHTPNGLHHRQPWHAAELKRAGGLNGVSDIILADTDDKCPTCGRSQMYAHELKTENGRLSIMQGRFLEDVAACGWKVATTYGWDETIAQLEGWGLVR